ncbi:hypothetical protein [Diaminobutyricimonas sp. LJ205]|uniref:hypothetical protein n=1 Tax=Diaminobutyricimonas sp. LJ205 TaxID=2683590 RepID=UPI0012F4F3E2|nr:hypothetical protein [Diaminobutyricimonas sp. LJ205]
MTLPAVLLAEGFDPEQVTPGVIGFLATAGVGILIVLLLIDMNRRIRRNTYRAQVRAQLEAERRAAEAGEEPDAAADTDLEADWPDDNKA